VDSWLDSDKRDLRPVGDESSSCKRGRDLMGQVWSVGTVLKGLKNPRGLK
jgi:hypothetical protein